MAPFLRLCQKQPLPSALRALFELSCWTFCFSCSIMLRSSVTGVVWPPFFMLSLDVSLGGIPNSWFLCGMVHLIGAPCILQDCHLAGWHQDTAWCWSGGRAFSSLCEIQRNLTTSAPTCGVKWAQPWCVNKTLLCQVFQIQAVHTQGLLYIIFLRIKTSN